jgi:site-specific DNA-methyltransferase (adenine-specific)
MRQAKSLTEPTIQQGNKALNERRIHPCHKPVLLYKKLLTMFAPPIETVKDSGFKVLDTHLGSGSNRIACFDYGIPHFTGIEIDKEYINDHNDWFAMHTELAKQRIF